ncbi:MAG: hypothetical protein ACRDH2_04070 [Anaerolineales bacterium]
MKTRLLALLSLLVAALLAVPGGLIAYAGPVRTSQPQVNSTVYLPIVVRAPTCPTSSGNNYAQGPVFQRDTDNPVRPAWNHADKNISLRGYNLNTSESKSLVNVGSDDPTMPPQLRTMFNPDRIPPFSNVYRINNWNWAPSPDPGTRGDEVTNPPVTVLGLQTTPGETLQAPGSGYDIGGGAEVIVLFADSDTVALKYTRDDSAGPNGYLLHVDNICTDPNLLAKYNSLDNAVRNTYHGTPDNNLDYDLVTLSEQQAFGTARDSEIRVAIVDSGTTQDPRSCFEFWVWQYPAPGGSCP